MSESPKPRPASLVRPAAAVVAGLALLGVAFWIGVRASGRDQPAPAPVLAAPVIAAPDAPPATPGPEHLASLAPAPAPTQAPARNAAGAAPAAPNFDIVRVSPRGDAVLAGRAEPGTDVAVLDNGKEIGRARAGPGGQFVVVPDRPLEPGARELTLGGVQQGDVVARSAPVIVVVPDQGAGTAAGPPAALALLAPDLGVPRLLQAPPAPDAASRGAKFGLDVIDYGQDGAIRFAGNGPAGATVRLYVDNRAAGDATADAQRRWFLSPTTDVAPGSHRIRADLLAANGLVEFRLELPFERDAVATSDLAGGHVVVQPRANLWRIARQAYGEGLRYTVIYQANKGQIRNPDLIYPGQVFSLPR